MPRCCGCLWSELPVQPTDDVVEQTRGFEDYGVDHTADSILAVEAVAWMEEGLKDQQSVRQDSFENSSIYQDMAELWWRCSKAYCNGSVLYRVSVIDD